MQNLYNYITEAREEANPEIVGDKERAIDLLFNDKYEIYKGISTTIAETTFTRDGSKTLKMCGLSKRLINAIYNEYDKVKDKGFLAPIVFNYGHKKGNFVFRRWVYSKFSGYNFFKGKLWDETDKKFKRDTTLNPIKGTGYKLYMGLHNTMLESGNDESFPSATQYEYIICLLHNYYNRGVMDMNENIKFVFNIAETEGSEKESIPTEQQLKIGRFTEGLIELGIYKDSFKALKDVKELRKFAEKTNVSATWKALGEFGNNKYSGISKTDITDGTHNISVKVRTHDNDADRICSSHFHDALAMLKVGLLALGDEGDLNDASVDLFRTILINLNNKYGDSPDISMDGLFGGLSFDKGIVTKRGNIEDFEKFLEDNDRYEGKWDKGGDNNSWFTQLSFPCTISHLRQNKELNQEYKDMWKRYQEIRKTLGKKGKPGANKALQEVFNKYGEFRKAVVYEALTGANKFKKSSASANHLFILGLQSGKSIFEEIDYEKIDTKGVDVAMGYKSNSNADMALQIMKKHRI